MKNKMYMSAVVVVCMISIKTVAWTQEETATKQECIAKVAEVVELVTAEGFEAVAPDIRPGGPYSWKADGYVFCMDAEEGIMLAHPYLPPQMLNRPLMDWRDSNGKPFIRDDGGIGPKGKQGVGHLCDAVSRQPGNAIEGDLCGESPRGKCDCGCRVFPTNRLETAMTRSKK